MLRYFAYGSNMDACSLRAKGVSPLRSRVAVVRDHGLRFNVAHWFRHEGGVASIEPAPGEHVYGVLHDLSEDALSRLDVVESYGVGYDRIDIGVHLAAEGGDAPHGEGPVSATTYVGLPAHVDDDRGPTTRYLNIILRGAESAGLPSAYTQTLRHHPTQAPPDYPLFEHPRRAPCFDAIALAQNPTYTAIAGAVFDMRDARPVHQTLLELFGGKDTTLFHLRRHDTSRGDETLHDLLTGALNDSQEAYLNAYAHEYAREYEYVGRFIYRGLTPDRTTT